MRVSWVLFLFFGPKFIVLFRFVALNDDFLVLVAAGNDGASSIDQTVTVLTRFTRLMVIAASTDWLPRIVQELFVRWSEPAECRATIRHRRW